MKNLIKLIITISMLAGLLTACQQESPKTKIGVILPLEHKALNEIVMGFSDKFREIYHQPVEIKVMNAQGDVNLQRAIIQQMRDQNFALIVPVATSVTQMAASMVHQQPIVSLAADFSEQDRKNLPNCIALVHDEIPPQLLIAFLHAAYPKLTQLTLIHSTSDKIYPEVKATIEAGTQYDIDVKPLMVATLPELVSSAQALPAQTQGIFILKDNLIVSGISTLAKAANDRHIPLFTSDQGSVQSGAGFGLGVHERQIGEEGAKLAADVLAGKKPCDLPVVEMKNLTVFINKKALQQSQQDITPIQSAAKELEYPIEIVEEK